VATTPIAAIGSDRSRDHSPCGAESETAFIGWDCSIRLAPSHRSACGLRPLPRSLPPAGIGTLGSDACRKGEGRGPFFGLHPSSAKG
jgi:hypothetical protein